MLKWIILYLTGREQESEYIPDFRKNAAATEYNFRLNIQVNMERLRDGL